MRPPIGLAVLSGILLLAGCTTPGGTASGPPGATAPPSSLVPASQQPTVSSVSPGTTGTGGPPPPASVVDPVIAEIARVAGIPVDQVTLVSAETVTFPDGSLGCPQPGMAYTQIPVDGYRIVAMAGGTTYDYRGTGGTFQRCVSAEPSAS